MKLTPVEKIAIEMSELADDPRYCKEKDIINMIKELSNINERDRDGRTLLVSAALYELTGIAKYLIKHGADTHLADKEGFTVLHAATYTGCYGIAKMVLCKDFPVNARDKYGNTALHRAKHTDLKLIKLLVDNGADSKIENNYGVSAYQSFLAYPKIIKIFDNEIEK